MRVFVYRNLHKNLWSLKAADGPDKGRVVAHASYLVLSKCKFKVSQVGRKRVIAEKRKNIHAGVEGELFSIFAANTFYEGVPLLTTTNHAFIDSTAYHKVAYNPYWDRSFMIHERQVMPIHDAFMTIFTPAGVMASR